MSQFRNKTLSFQAWVRANRSHIRVARIETIECERKNPFRCCDEIIASYSYGKYSLCERREISFAPPCLAQSQEYFRKPLRNLNVIIAQITDQI